MSDTRPIEERIESATIDEDIAHRRADNLRAGRDEWAGLDGPTHSEQMNQADWLETRIQEQATQDRIAEALEGILEVLTQTRRDGMSEYDRATSAYFSE